MGIIRCSLIKEGIVIIRQGTVHLIGGHMQEPLPFLKATVRQFPGGLGTVEHHCRAQHIGLDKHFRAADTSVHMALSCKMHHPVNLILRKDLPDGFLITDICLYKGVILPVLHILQIFQVPGIGQRIHIDDADLIPVLPEHIVYIVGTDKAGSSRHQISSHVYTFLCVLPVHTFLPSRNILSFLSTLYHDLMHFSAHGIRN